MSIEAAYDRGALASELNPRYGTHVLYQLLAVCDVTPMERYLAASLVTRAAQRVIGEQWADQLASMPGLG